MKRLNHKTLGVVCGIVLLIIIVVNLWSDEEAPNVGTKEEAQVTSYVEETTSLNPNSIIDMSNRGLSEVPEIVFKRSTIEVLDVSNNNLRGALQAEIRNMSSLRVLDMSDNMLTGIPAEIGQLKHLEVLDVSNNQITGLPYEIGNLQNLLTLDLHGNNYSEQDLEVIKQSLPPETDIIVE